MTLSTFGSVAVDIPGWKHKRGTRLNAPGKQVIYERADGVEIWVEALNEPCEPRLGFWGAMWTADGHEMIVGPIHWTPGGHTNPKDRALSWLTDTMWDNLVCLDHNPLEPETPCRLELSNGSIIYGGDCECGFRGGDGE